MLRSTKLFFFTLREKDIMTRSRMQERSMFNQFNYTGQKTGRKSLGKISGFSSAAQQNNP